jgi:hypothetical protein
LWPPDLCQVFAQQPDRNRTVTNRRCNAFHTAMSDVADGEHAEQTGFEGQRRPRQMPVNTGLR